MSLSAAAQIIRRRYDAVIIDPPPIVAAPLITLATIRGSVSMFYYSDSWAGVAQTSEKRALRAASSLFGALEKWSAKRSDLTIAVTPSLEKRARAWAGERVTLVENGTDLDAFSLTGPPWNSPPSFPDRFFVYAGTTGFVHGAEIFIEAADRLWRMGEDFGLVYVGYGAELGRVKDRAARCRGPVLFLDRQPKTVVASLFRSSRGALSSMRPIPAYEDARPTKTMAGMSCGAPAIYSAEGAMADEIRRNGLGFVSPWEVSGTAESMQRALNLSPSELHEMRVRCSRYAQQHFDQADKSQSIARLLESLMERK
jgi:glycosyltransferase involved in cell wall biosynthesis